MNVTLTSVLGNFYHSIIYLFRYGTFVTKCNCCYYIYHMYNSMDLSITLFLKFYDNIAKWILR